jgi:hypothetical protein
MSWRRSGTSPILWLDSVRENHAVLSCLSGTCSALGEATSVPGIFAEGGWLPWRVFLQSFGLGWTGLHLLLLAMFATGVLLAARCAAAEAGGAGAALTVVCLALLWREDQARLEPVFNAASVPALGALLLAVSSVAARSGRLAPLIVAALLAAVMANVHTACLLAGVSVVWIAALSPPAVRWRRILIAAAAFGVATFLISPVTWSRNAQELLARRSLASVSSEVIATSQTGVPIFLGAALVVLWLLVLVLRLPWQRRLDACIAVAAPPMLVVASHLGGVRSSRHLGHIQAAVGAGLAIAFVHLVGGFAPRFVKRLLMLVAPFAFPLMALALGPRTTSALPQWRVDEEQAALRVLTHERQWSWVAISRQLKSLEDPVSFALMRDLQPGGEASRGSEPETAILLKVRNDLVPSPRPPRWQVVGESDGATALVIPSPAAIAWDSFRACLRRGLGMPFQCSVTGMPDPRDESGYPIVGFGKAGEVAELQLHLRLLPRSGETHLFMPRLPGLCGGRIVNLKGEGTISADRRRAVVSASATEVTLSWMPGSADCPASTYDLYPPFFVATDAANAGLLTDILEHEAPSLAPGEGAPLPGDPESVEPPRRCVSGGIDPVVQRLIDTGRFKEALPAGWALKSAAANGRGLTLGIADARGVPHAVEVALFDESSRASADGHFFRINSSPGESAADAQALIRAARLVDAAVDEKALTCGEQQSTPPQPRPPTMPRTLSWFEGLIETALLAAALWMAGRSSA